MNLPEESDAGKTRVFRVELEEEGERIDRFLTARLPLSRSAIQRLLSQGRITLGGEKVRSSRRLEAGDDIEARIPDVGDRTPQPEAIPLTLLHEDDHVVLINKPWGMTVHPGEGQGSGTLVNALLHRYPSLYVPDDDTLRAGIVHRLDRDTSGVLLVARTQTAGEHLKEQFKARTVSKEYHAVVHGSVEFDEGEVNLPIGRDPKRFDRRRGDPEGGKPARTVYRVIERFPRHTLVRFQPHTGRTHQIRIHAQHLGYAVVGDRLYPPRRRPTGPPPIRRQALHARCLSFDHPRTGDRMLVKAPWPEDFEQLVEKLRTGMKQ